MFDIISDKTPKPIVPRDLNMNPSENEFLAENEKIEIVPKFSHSVMTLIQGDVGPFKAGQVTKVPLWLAVMFKNGDKCSIETPEWLDLGRASIK